MTLSIPPKKKPKPLKDAAFAEFKKFEVLVQGRSKKTKKNEKE